MNALIKRKRTVLLSAMAALLLLASLACVRSLGQETETSEDAAAATKDAQVQATLSALLASATGEIVPSATATPEAEDTGAKEADTATPTEASVQLTELAAALTSEAGTPSATATPPFGGSVTETPTPTLQATAANCYEHRFAYDETIPDGTRLDPGEAFQKTWRLQNVGTCDWQGGDYALAFVSGTRMSGSNPYTITYSVPAGGYANFSLNLIAPSTPGTYRGYWILETADGELIGRGPNHDQPFWVEIQVRGATPTPTP